MTPLVTLIGNDPSGEALKHRRVGRRYPRFVRLQEGSRKREKVSQGVRVGRVRVGGACKEHGARLNPRAKMRHNLSGFVTAHPRYTFREFSAPRAAGSGQAA